VYSAALAASPSTTHDQFKGLKAYSFLMVQLSSGSLWIRDFRIWAAAKGTCVWGGLNLSIYGRCLSLQRPSSRVPGPKVNKLLPSKSKPYEKKRQAYCYK